MYVVRNRRHAPHRLEACVTFVLVFFSGLVYIFGMNKKSLAVLSLAVLALGAPALARDFSDDHRGGGGQSRDHGGSHSGGHGVYISGGRGAYISGGRYDHGSSYGRHYYGGYDYGNSWGYRPRWNFGFGISTWPYGGPYYYDYEPGVVYSRPVYIERPVYAGRSLEAEVQRALSSKGYHVGAIDGEVGPQTRAAIRAYQDNRGLAVTGRIDTTLLRSLKLL